MRKARADSKIIDACVSWEDPRNKPPDSLTHKVNGLYAFPNNVKDLKIPITLIDQQ